MAWCQSGWNEDNYLQTLQLHLRLMAEQLKLGHSWVQHRTMIQTQVRTGFWLDKSGWHRASGPSFPNSNWWKVCGPGLKPRNQPFQWKLPRRTDWGTFNQRLKSVSKRVKLIRPSWWVDGNIQSSPVIKSSLNQCFKPETVYEDKQSVRSYQTRSKNKLYFPFTTWFTFIVLFLVLYFSSLQ